MSVCFGYFLRAILKPQPNLKTFGDFPRLKLIYPTENVLVVSHQGYITINSLFAAKTNCSEFSKGQSLLVCVSN